MLEDEDDFQSGDEPLQGASQSGDQGQQGEAGSQGEDGVSADPALLDAINQRLDQHAQLAQALEDQIKQMQDALTHLFPIREPDKDPALENAKIELLLTQVGGVSGTNKSANCTFTYDAYNAVTDAAKTIKIGTAVALTGNGNGWRGLKLALTAGTRGSGYKDQTGTLVLTYVDEKPAGEQDCT